MHDLLWDFWRYKNLTGQVISKVQIEVPAFYLAANNRKRFLKTEIQKQLENSRKILKRTRLQHS